MVKLFHIWFFFESLVDQHEDSSGLLWHAAYIYGIIKKSCFVEEKDVFFSQMCRLLYSNQKPQTNKCSVYHEI